MLSAHSYRYRGLYSSGSEFISLYSSDGGYSYVDNHYKGRYGDVGQNMYAKCCDQYDRDGDRYGWDLDLNKCLDATRQEVFQMEKPLRTWEFEILDSNPRGREFRASNNEIVATFESYFSEESDKLFKEIEVAKHEEEKAKKALKGLALALHMMTVENNRETQERLFEKWVKHEDAYALIEQMRLALKYTEENYEVMLNEARYRLFAWRKP